MSSLKSLPGPQRLKVDLLVAQRIADANAQLKQQMLHLSPAELEAADSNPSAEEDLDALLSQVDTIRDRLKVVKAKCFEFKHVPQDSMDRMCEMHALLDERTPD
ncbi:hypothetical protein PINS_up009247 [Pythium insidiosum]|nr:hypothetical protein PINS_up009247 [Pythium insidiosum]